MVPLLAAPEGLDRDGQTETGSVCVCVCVCVCDSFVLAIHRDGGYYDNRRGGDPFDRRDEYYGSRYNRDDRYCKERYDELRGQHTLNYTCTVLCD